MDMNLSKLRELVMDREARHAAVHEVAKSWKQLSGELNWISAWNVFFHPFMLSLPVSLRLKWIFHRQHIVGSCSFILLVIPWLLIEEFNLFMFVVKLGEGNGNPLQCSCLKNPRDGESGGLLSMGSHRVGHDWSDLAAAAAAEPYSNLQQTSEFKVFISVPRIVFNEIKTTDYIKISTLRHFNTSRNTENPI